MSSTDRNSNYRLRSSSPGLILREYNKAHEKHEHNICRKYTYSYLKDGPSLGYLKRPIDPYDKPPTSPHFHHPSSSSSFRSNTRSSTLKSSGGRSRSAMRVLVESIKHETPTPRPRPKSSHINNKEPIEMAHFPAAKPPGRGEKAKIERDDFPAPPYPFADPECRKRWSSCYGDVSVLHFEGEVDGVEEKYDCQDKIKKEEEELIKISSCSGIGNILLQDLKQHEKLQKWRQFSIDPRNASRCPSASKEPAYRLRYHSVDRFFLDKIDFQSITYFR